VPTGGPLIPKDEGNDGAAARNTIVLYY